MPTLPKDFYDTAEWQTSIHEAGRCLGARLAGVRITEATIVPHRNTDGHVNHDLCGHEDTIIICLLGHASELEFGFAWCKGEGEFSTDYERAQREMREIIRINRGFSVEDRCKTRRWQFGSHQLWKDHQKKLRVSKKDWKPEFDKLVRKARRLTTKHNVYILRVATLLMEKRTLTNEEIPQLCLPN